MNVEYVYRALVERVVDGDTIECVVDLGFGSTMKKKFRIFTENNKYFDTPESWRPKTEEEAEHGSEAKERAIELLEGKVVVLRSVKQGKYRYLAEVFMEDNLNYADVMISEGYQKRENYGE